MFNLSVVFLMIVASQKCCPYSADFVEGTGKIQLEPDQESMGGVLVFVTNVCLLRNS
jgi:hypothetical protein